MSMNTIDNVNCLFGDDLKCTIQPGARLKIAASCFSMYAFEALKEKLKHIEELQFIFTEPTFTNNLSDLPHKERKEFHIPKVDRERSLYGNEFEIQLRNQLTQRFIAKECAAWMKNKARFKSNRTKAPMTSFAYVGTENSNTLYMPLHGFTAVDLGYQPGNTLLNIITKINDGNLSSVYTNLFNQIWNDPEKLEDVTSSVHEHIASIYKENSPESIYFFILHSIFKDFLEDLNDDVLANSRTGYQDTLIWKKLFNYQKDAVNGIINKLETYNGCILADSVGLGKTFTALAVIKYYELRNKSVLVLCPKKLADNWINYNKNLKTNIFYQDRFGYDVLCHTDLNRTSGSSNGMPLDRINWGNYDLVVIDESHNFRNNDIFKDKETRYQKLMRMVIKDGVKTKVLMLSATPVNNRFNDLRNQLALAYEGNSEILSQKLGTQKSIEEIFRNAQTTFNTWSNLPPEKRTARSILDSLDFEFFQLLDSVTIARSRKQIQSFYDTKDIGSFPERLKPLSFRCAITQRQDAPEFNAIFEQLSRLKLAVYAPISYVLKSRLKKYEDRYDTQVGGKGTLKQSDRERSLQALMTTNLLKRLESSIEAFRLTLKALSNNHHKMLAAIASFKLNGIASEITDGTETLNNIESDEDDIFTSGQQHEVGGKIKINLADMDWASWEHDLNVDLTIIESLFESMSKISPEDDTKLSHVKKHIAEKLANPINPNNKKIILFTAFADTADYLYKHLSARFEGENIHIAKVTGKGNPKSTLKKSYNFQDLLTLFSPRSKEKELTLPDEQAEIDILIATDCISEGQNLQDCDYLINYDIHWNPVRIIQRFGRIDRIGSVNSRIQLVNYWPDISLDEYINLKERVESRMMITDVTATGDDNVLSAQANDVSYRKEQLHRLQEEVIELEDLKTGVSITDLGLNDFRMDLLNYVKEKDSERNQTSNGIHAVITENPSLGLKPGVIFALRNQNTAISLNQHNRLHPYYLIYIGKEGVIINTHTEVKNLLDLIRSACKGRTEPNHQACKSFNKETNDGKKMKTYSDLLNKSIHSMISLKEENDVDSLFSGGKTTALTNIISGLEDFELIAFLVIQEAS